MKIRLPVRWRSLRSGLIYLRSLSRLESHLGQFIGSCDSDEQSGRRLDFIGQEMLREANTIGSKAQDSDIARWVVDIKCLVDVSRNKYRTLNKKF